VAIRRWQAFTGLSATLRADERQFDRVAAERAAEPSGPIHSEQVEEGQDE